VLQYAARASALPSRGTGFELLLLGLGATMCGSSIGAVAAGAAAGGSGAAEPSSAGAAMRGREDAPEMWALGPRVHSVPDASSSSYSAVCSSGTFERGSLLCNLSRATSAPFSTVCNSSSGTDALSSVKGSVPAVRSEEEERTTRRPHERIEPPKPHFSKRMSSISRSASLMRSRSVIWFSPGYRPSASVPRVNGRAATTGVQLCRAESEAPLAATSSFCALLPCVKAPWARPAEGGILVVTALASAVAAISAAPLPEERVPAEDVRGASQQTVSASPLSASIAEVPSVPVPPGSGCKAVEAAFELRSGLFTQLAVAIATRPSAEESPLCAAAEFPCTHSRSASPSKLGLPRDCPDMADVPPSGGRTLETWSREEEVESPPRLLVHLLLAVTTVVDCDGPSGSPWSTQLGCVDSLSAEVAMTLAASDASATASTSTALIGSATGRPNRHCVMVLLTPAAAAPPASCPSAFFSAIGGSWKGDRGACWCANKSLSSLAGVDSKTDEQLMRSAISRDAGDVEEVVVMSMPTGGELPEAMAQSPATGTTVIEWAARVLGLCVVVAKVHGAQA
jgi:hypothetical protein